MLMSQYVADAKVGVPMWLSELRQDLALGRAAETAPDGYGKGLITPQTIALWAYRHVKRIRFPERGAQMQEGVERRSRSLGFARDLKMSIDVEHPRNASSSHHITIVAMCTLGGRVFARQAEVSWTAFPKHHRVVVESARQLMQALVQSALADSYEIAPENDDTAVGLSVVDSRDMNMFPDAERRSVREHRFSSWYGSGAKLIDPRTFISESVLDEASPLQRAAAGAVWGVQPPIGDHKHTPRQARIDVGLDLSSPRRLGEFELEGPQPKTEQELRQLARELNVSFDLLKAVARGVEGFDASLRGLQRAAEAMRPLLVGINKAMGRMPLAGARIVDTVQLPAPPAFPDCRCEHAVEQLAEMERQVRMSPIDYQQFTCGPGCSGAPDCACPTCTAKDEALIDKLQHKLAADTARRLVGTDGSRELLVRPRDVARFEGWGDYAARLMLTRPDEITDELWQHALEILAGERPDLPF